MARIKILNLENVKRETRFKILKNIRDPSLLDQIGETVRNDIQTGPELAPLKESTISSRRYLERFNATHPQYSPSKSIVTFTGELLNALEVRINTVKGMIVLGFKKGIHTKYKTGGTRKKKQSGSKSKGISYEQLAEYLIDGNENMEPRPFMTLRSKVISKITTQVKDHLKKVFRVWHNFI